VLRWGGGNLGSVRRAIERAGARAELTERPEDVLRADRLVLPGVGAFGAVVAGLRERSLWEPLRERLAGQQRPFLGICVGLQALFLASEESPGVAGLGLIDARVERLRARKVPQVGWNEVEPTGAAGDLVERGHAYFVHSYCAPAAAGAPWLAATTDHDGRFASAAVLGPSLAVQFHPEKSGAYGARLIERWLAS
jgi:glutamine amidotransferase/cyclase